MNQPEWTPNTHGVVCVQGGDISRRLCSQKSKRKMVQGIQPLLSDTIAWILPCSFEKQTRSDPLAPSYFRTRKYDSTIAGYRISSRKLSLPPFLLPSQETTRAHLSGICADVWEKEKRRHELDPMVRKALTRPLLIWSLGGLTINTNDVDCRGCFSFIFGNSTGKAHEKFWIRPTDPKWFGSRKLCWYFQSILMKHR